MNFDYGHRNQRNRYSPMTTSEEITSLTLIEDRKDRKDRRDMYGGAQIEDDDDKALREEFRMLLEKAKEYRDRMTEITGHQSFQAGGYDDDEYLEYGQWKSNVVTGGRDEYREYGEWKKNNVTKDYDVMALRNNRTSEEKHKFPRSPDTELMQYPYEDAYNIKGKDYTRRNDAGQYGIFKRPVNDDDEIYTELDNVNRDVDFYNTDTQQWSLAQTADYTTDPDIANWRDEIGSQLGGAKKSGSSGSKRPPNAQLMKGIEIAKFLKESGKYNNYKWKDLIKITKIVVDEAKEGGSSDPEVYGEKAKKIAIRDSDRIIKKFESQKK